MYMKIIIFIFGLNINYYWLAFRITDVLLTLVLSLAMLDRLYGMAGLLALTPCIALGNPYQTVYN